MKHKLLLFTLLCIFGRGFSQTQFWSDDFEASGSPSAGSRTPSTSALCGGPPRTAYFANVGTTDISTATVYTGFSGSAFWAMEDIDKGPTCVNNSISAHQNVTWSSINISGKTGLSFKGLFAVGNTAQFDGFGWVNSGGTSIYDYLIVEYRIDGGPWTDALRFFPSINNSGSGTLALETTGDSIAESEGPGLTPVATEFSALITGTGTTLDLRAKAFSNSSGEEILIDNFRLFETAACTAPVITANPPNRAICAGNNTTFTSNASGATAFQWQENSGSGFTDIVNGGVYSNATTNILTITGATAGMNGYLYRCRAMNGAVSCFTNTNQATLTVSSVNTSSVSQTNVSCNGFSNGAASVSPTGGIAPYGYSWSPSGGTGSIATGLSAGSYTVTVTDNIGCSATRNYTITQPTALNGSTVVTNVACNGTSTGAINLTPSGGTPGYTFDWGGGVTTEDRTGLAAGTYSVTITDANACTKTVSGITVTQPTAISGSTVVTNVACNSGTTGAINLTPSGGTPGYTFSWGGGVTTEDRTSLAAGSYSVTITDANGCTGIVNATVTQPTAISGSTVVTNVACNGGTTGAINLTPSGGTPGYTFSWGGGVTTEDRTSLAAGSYSVTITDANGCTGIVNATVTQPTGVSGSTVVTNVACNGGTTGAINLTPSGGTPGYTFSWGGGVTTEDRTSLAAGSYSVTITDANGCTGIVNATVTQPTAISVTPASQTNVACNGGANGAASINTPTGGAGGYTYNWTPGNPTGDGTISVTGLNAGTWTCTVTDANSCTASQSFTVTQPTALSVTAASQTNVSCNGGANGAASINTPTGGAGGYTYNWTPGNPTGDGTVSVTGLTAGTWTCTVTDVNSCTASQAFTVTQPTAISVTAASQTNVSCNGGTNGAAEINTPTGGTPGYTYDWTPGTPTGDGTTSITGLTAGSYTVTVTDANGCTANQSFTVTQPTAISVSAASQTNVSCNNGADGAASINTPTGGAGGYTYNWTPGNPTGDGTISVTGLTAGTWTCTVTDANACTAFQSFTVTQPTALSVTAASQTNVSCNGGANGAASINTPTGGAGGYTYNWTPGNPTGDGTVSVTGLTAGTWTCTVTDANSCTASQAFTVTQPTAISVTAASQTNVSCNGGTNGAAEINTPTGGTPGYTYDWTPGTPTGDGTTSITGLTAGSYTVTVTDANGCTANQSFTVTQPTAISVTAASQTNVACNGGANGAAEINTPTGGTPGYTYDWTPGNPTGDGTTSITGLTAGSYTVTVTDANGCTANQSFTVTQPTALSVTAASQTNVSCDGGANGAASIDTPTGGVGGYTYDWTPGTPTGDGTTSITGLTAGTYTVTVTDANSCTASQVFTVTQPTAISVTPASQTNVACNGGSTGAVAINTPTGGTPGYTYDWTPGTPTGDGTTSITGLTAGTWTCTVTDANGCTETVAMTITESALITSTVSATACDVYTLNSSSYTSSGIYTQNLIAQNGCDSILTLNLTINHSTTSTLTATACDSYTLNGTPYTTSGVYTQVLTNAAGCDSTITLNLTINNSTASALTETACSSFTLNGTPYTTSGVYTQVLTNAAGCDSTITLNLTINQPTTSTLTETACDSYTLNGTPYTTSGVYTQVLTNAAGCDSTITLNLTINNSTTSTLTETACDSYTLNGTPYTTSGVYTQVLTNAAGCDSTITLNLTINNSTTSTLTETVCESYFWSETGLTYTTSGIYSNTLTGVNGCDSVLVLDLTVTGLPVATATDNGNATITASTGASYQWINCTTNTVISGATAQTFAPTANGTYAVIVTNSANCSDTSNCVVIGNVGLDEKSNSFGVVLTPNPAQNDVKIDFTGANEASIVIYDAQGKVVMTINQALSGEVLSIEAFERGVYLVKITTNSGNHTERLVKQ